MEGVYGGLEGIVGRQWKHVWANRVRLDELVAKIPCHITDFYILDRNRLKNKIGYVMTNVAGEER